VAAEHKLPLTVRVITLGPLIAVSVGPLVKPLTVTGTGVALGAQLHARAPARQNAIRRHEGK
jgi:hypothetical protein